MPEDPTSFEVDRLADDQPPREDLIDPQELEELEDPGPDDRAEAGGPGADEALPTSEEQPESQGEDTLEAPRATEDAGRRHPLSDEDRG